jgi:hypothetical protein
MFMARLLEIILIVLILRAIFSIVLPIIRGRPRGRGPVKRYEEDRFDKKKMDIVDGEFKELK